MQSEQKISRPMLTAMVVGSMAGAGVFSLPRTFGFATGPVGALIAWAIAGGGMYMPARVFQALAERKPELDAGVFACAKVGLATVPAFCRRSANESQLLQGAHRIAARPAHDSPTVFAPTKSNSWKIA